MILGTHLSGFLGNALAECQAACREHTFQQLEFESGEVRGASWKEITGDGEESADAR